MSETQPTNQEIESSQSNEAQQNAPLPPGIHVGKRSDIGRERERNEDSLFALEMFVQHDSGIESLELFVVADGMGGHQRGEVASSLAARVAANSILTDVYLPYLTNDQNANNRPLNEALEMAVQDANSAVLDQVPDGGTTITMALLMGNNAYIAHVGDSRAYLYKQDSLKRITQDHSLAQRLEQMGQSVEDAMQVQNVLYRAIGQADAVEVDTHLQHVPPQASLVLCSDGLWGMVSDDDIKNILETAATPQQACDQLVALANENGGRDNITVIIVSRGIEA